MGCQFSKTKRQARVQHRVSAIAPQVQDEGEKEVSVEMNEESARRTTEIEVVEKDAILNDLHFMNPNEGVETALPENISVPDLQVDPTQSDEVVKSPPPAQPHRWEAMQQALEREEAERRRQKEKLQRRKALKKAQMKRQRSIPEEDTLYELSFNARMPEVDYNSEEYTQSGSTSGKVLI